MIVYDDNRWHGDVWRYSLVETMYGMRVVFPVRVHGFVAHFRIEY